LCDGIARRKVSQQRPEIEAHAAESEPCKTDSEAEEIICESRTKGVDIMITSMQRFAPAALPVCRVVGVHGLHIVVCISLFFSGRGEKLFRALFGERGAAASTDSAGTYNAFGCRVSRVRAQRARAHATPERRYERGCSHGGRKDCGETLERHFKRHHHIEQSTNQSTNRVFAGSWLCMHAGTAGKVSDCAGGSAVCGRGASSGLEGATGCATAWVGEDGAGASGDIAFLRAARALRRVLMPTLHLLSVWAQRSRGGRRQNAQ
jgi:hypothetical protein